MDGKLVKDLEHMYLVFDIKDIDENEYVLQMLLRAKLPSILPLSISTTDGKASLRAEVTGCTSIASRFQSVPLTGSDIRKILSTIRDVICRLPGYLLDPGDLRLAPECIFLGAGGDEVLLCYVPHQSESDPDTIRILADYFLKKLDHSDRAAADLVYSLYDRVAAEHYAAGDILQELLKEAGSSRMESGQAGVFQTEMPQTEMRQRGMPRTKTGPAGIPQMKAAQADIPCSGRSIGEIRHLPPPKGGRRKQRAGGRKRKRRNTDRAVWQRRRRKTSLRMFLPAVLILLSAAAAILLFRMDLTQIGGMGFLCAALIWLTYSTIGKQRSEIHNVWADEDDPGDDAFYQSLLKKVYAEDELQARGLQASAYTQKAEGPCLVSLQQDRCGDIPLSASHLILGKSREKADIVLPDDTVSRIHARIELRTDGFYVNDLYSTNGTWLNGRRIEPGNAVRLSDGAALGMGSLQFRVQL